MLSLKELFDVADSIAPIKLSHEMIKMGDYDNSGILVNAHPLTERVLFSLDLSVEAVKKARANKCDTIITHHPAIYYAIKNLSVEDSLTSPVANALKNKMNVISMHLNLDIADGGIDASLCEGLGGEKFKILSTVNGGGGYGREFPVNKKLCVFRDEIKKKFRTNKLIVYGNPSKVIKKAASFCGAGSSYALDIIKNKGTDADLIITSDMKHNELSEMIENGKSVIIIPHYVSEEYGFRKFYSNMDNKIKNKVQTFYFDDKRFR